MSIKQLFSISLGVVLCVCAVSCSNTSSVQKQKDANGYEYETVKGDMTHARIYTLKNGLTVYLSKNTEKPRINTAIAVRVGSKNDPTTTTGLAHYFEHIMFKGTDKLGTSNWPEEKKMIAQISDLFEKHNAEQDEAKKKEIYHQIDSVSYLASKYAIANEYDKAVAAIGATGTNAYTSLDRTVYVNDIPSNEVDRWLQLESDRFENVVLRLFHTELEAVYEEYNMGQDRDGAAAYHLMMGTVFPNHPYGRSVLGWPKDLKNPSMVNILKFKAQYYVPNNVAICMAGDLDYEKTIKLIDKYWGALKPNPNMHKEEFKETFTSDKPVEKTLLGPEAEFMYMAYRTKGSTSNDAKYLRMIDMILSNSKAGLIDLDLVQKQKVLNAFSTTMLLNDYGLFMMGGAPREGQSLEDIKTLLLQELDKLKKGDFDEWLLEANLKQMKLQKIASFEANGTTDEFIDAFISGESWSDAVNEINEMEKISKADLVKFANDFFKDDYFVIYKRKGVNTSVVHMDKPQITPVEMNRDKVSDYLKNFEAEKSESISPVFLDFDKQINKQSLAKDIDFYYTKNESNPLSSISIVLGMGKKNNIKLPLALNYLKYLGTEKYSAADLQKEFYKLGLTFDVNTGQERSIIFVNGLDESMNQGLQLLEEVLSTAKPDDASYKQYVDGILKQRADDKLNKSNILFNKMPAYVKYGKINPSTDILSEQELKAIKPQELVDLIKSVITYPHLVYYYGPRSQEDAFALVKKCHTAQVSQVIPPAKEYPTLPIDKQEVYFCNYDMVQTHILLMSRDGVFDPALLPEISLFGEYYGGNMSSIVFQEMREARSLAYSAQLNYITPHKKGDYNYVLGAIFTQPDKMGDCLKAFNGLLNNMSRSETSFQNARKSIIKEINSQRIIKDEIFGTYLSAKDLGINYDSRKNVYDFAQHATLDDLQKFFDNHIKGKKYAILVLGKKSQVDFKKLKEYGEVKELSLEDLFGY